MGNKGKALFASILGLIAMLGFGYQDVGAMTLTKLSFFAASISIPLMVVVWKFKATLSKAPRALVPVGIVIGAIMSRFLSHYSKTALILFAITLGIMMVFLCLVSSDKELEEK
ncbi:hypothetical protein [Geobacter sp. OR-1]|uniref:hypothetical protein n=1 Tax=Geobacter sp. OR-1 TaxID=1266765 RepID=UPI0005A9A5CE|nr:hypothetical protein [Geobacter sp. OR-1]